jgi:hypothetical protein
MHTCIHDIHTHTIAAVDAGVENWRYALGNAQYGSGCTMFYHAGASVCIEVFHGNGWFRFKSGSSPQVLLCVCLLCMY